MNNEHGEQTQIFCREKVVKMEKFNKHYTDLKIEPWEVMKATFTEEEWRGFLKGNIIKYVMRNKGQDEMDATKIVDYAQELVKTYGTICKLIVPTEKLRTGMLKHLYAQGYRFIARDKDGDRLYAYEEKPEHGMKEWLNTGGKLTNISSAFSNVFNNISWQDEEPYNIEH